MERLERKFREGGVELRLGRVVENVWLVYVRKVTLLVHVHGIIRRERESEGGSLFFLFSHTPGGREWNEGMRSVSRAEQQCQE